MSIKGVKLITTIEELKFDSEIHPLLANITHLAHNEREKMYISSSFQKINNSVVPFSDIFTFEVRISIEFSLYESSIKGVRLIQNVQALAIPST